MLFKVNENNNNNTNNNKKRKNKGLIVFVSDDIYHSSSNDYYVYSLQHSQFLLVAPEAFVSLQQVITAWKSRGIPCMYVMCTDLSCHTRFTYEMYRVRAQI